MEYPPEQVVHVSNLPVRITVDFLKTLFSECGNVVNVTLKERPNGCFAFIAFDSSEAALTAIKEFNYTKLNGIPIVITPTTKEFQDLIKSGEGNLYVKGLDEYIEISQLHELFQTYGEVISCKLPLNPDGKNIGYAYVQFKDPKNAEKARVELNDATINGKKIIVENYQSKKKPVQTNFSTPQGGPSFNEETFTNIFIKNLPSTITNDNDLGKFFSEFGLVLSTKLLPDRQSGFCNMYDHDSAVRAIKALNGRVIEGKAIEATRAMGKEERMNSLQMGYQNPPAFSSNFGGKSTFSPPSSGASPNQNSFGSSSTTTIGMSNQQGYSSSSPYNANQSFGNLPHSQQNQNAPPMMSSYDQQGFGPNSGGQFGQGGAFGQQNSPYMQNGSFGHPNSSFNSPYGQPSGSFNHPGGSFKPQQSYNSQGSSSYGMPQNQGYSSPYGSAFGSNPQFGNGGSPYGAPYDPMSSPYGSSYGAPPYGMQQQRNQAPNYGYPYGMSQGYGQTKAHVYSASGH